MKMIIFKHAKELSNFFHLQKVKNKIGFVPTMGALHDGHIFLIEQAKKKSNIVICSIFVNPTQFNDVNDYKKYPVSLEEDIKLLEFTGTDILFLPGIDEIYPTGTTELEIYDIGFLETILEGKFRPGHFQGVCQVVSRLIKIIQPDEMFMGQKDLQQCLVIKRLLNMTDPSVHLVICPTVREPSGLAMSSRNKRLNEGQKSSAIAIHRALLYIKNSISPGQLDQIKNNAAFILAQNNFKIDYVELVDAETFEIVSTWNGKQKLAVLIAAFLGDVRLIDNMLL